MLREAGVKTTPLLERLKFVAITASNLDEFFMVRVAGLWDQYENGINKRDAAGLTVKAQLEEISKAAHDQMKLLNKYLLSLVKELREAGIYICRVSELSEKGAAGWRLIIRKKFSRYLRRWLLTHRARFRFWQTKR